MERYSLAKAHGKLERPIEQIKDVMRYSDVRGVTINKFEHKDKDGVNHDRFYTSIQSSMYDDDIDIDSEEE